MLASYFNFVPRRIYLRHGILYETSSGFKRGILIFFEKFTSLLSTKVLCVSQSVLNISLNDNLNSSHKTCLISKGSCNGVDSVNFFNPDLVTKETLNIYKAKHNIDDNDFVIGFVGRIVNDKGIKEILLAWDVLKSRYKNLKLILAGPLEDRDGIHSHLISKILNDNRIVFLGQIKETNVYYKLMNLFLLPSYREGFPTVILEASSMGLPVVTSRKTGCIDSIIENVTGKYCEISPNSIVQVLEEYIQNSDLCIQHGLNGRKFVRENFEQEVIWNSLLKLYSGEN
jgi:glycosyltransferase involved in cell wall biosynthesis